MVALLVFGGEVVPLGLFIVIEGFEFDRKELGLFEGAGWRTRLVRVDTYDECAKNLRSNIKAKFVAAADGLDPIKPAAADFSRRDRHNNSRHAS